MGKSSIEWTKRTWNPVRGCTPVSPGCKHCYAAREAVRHAGEGGAYEGLAKSTKAGPRWTGKVRFVPEKLAEPLRWQKPVKIFVNSMSDLFHESLTFEQIAAVFGVMAAARRHTFQVLTKRPERAVEFFKWLGADRDAVFKCVLAVSRLLRGFWPSDERPDPGWQDRWPLTNVWLGVSAEDPPTAGERVPAILECPAAVYFVSYEPALAAVDLRPWLQAKLIDGGMNPQAFGRSHESRRLDWVIAGGESGPKARPADVAWFRDVLDQCKEAGVAFFMKQLGAVPVLAHDDKTWPREFPPHVEIEPRPGRPDVLHLRDRKGGDPSEWPEDLRVRMFPGDSWVAGEAQSG